jgi:hypothetical protein
MIGVPAVATVSRGAGDMDLMGDPQAAPGRFPGLARLAEIAGI